MAGDEEDRRLLESLAKVAAAAYLLRGTLESTMQAREELERSTERLRRANE